MDTGSFLGVKFGRGVLLTTHPFLVLWSWNSRAIPLPILWPHRACNGITLPLPFNDHCLNTPYSLTAYSLPGAHKRPLSLVAHYDPIYKQNMNEYNIEWCLQWEAERQPNSEIQCHLLAAAETINDYSEQNRESCAGAATKPLLGAVNSLCTFAGSPELTSQPAKISVGACAAQEPILSSGRAITDRSCAMAVSPRDPPTWHLLASHSKSVSGSIKKPVTSIRYIVPVKWLVKQRISRLCFVFISSMWGSAF